MKGTIPRWSRWTWVGVHTGAILHRQSPSQSMHVSAVKVSLTAGESARMAISTSLIDTEGDILSEGPVRPGARRPGQVASHTRGRLGRPYAGQLPPFDEKVPWPI